MEYSQFIEKITTSELKQLLLDSKENSILNAVLFSEIEGGNIKTSIIPHTLFPSPFPALLFQEAKELQFLINIIIYVMSMDRDFIIKSLENISKSDDFVYKLLQVLKFTKVNQFPQIGYAAILRSDYMVDELNSTCCKPQNLKQVEINTISSSFGCHSVGLTEIHKNLLYTLYQNTLDSNTKHLILSYLEKLPKNKTILSL